MLCWTLAQPGLFLNSGSEHHCRKIREYLDTNKPFPDGKVATPCTWKNHLLPCLPSTLLAFPFILFVLTRSRFVDSFLRGNLGSGWAELTLTVTDSGLDWFPRCSLWALNSIFSLLTLHWLFPFLHSLSAGMSCLYRDPSDRLFRTTVSPVGWFVMADSARD